MRQFRMILTISLTLLISSNAVTMAEDTSATDAAGYTPSVGDLMIGIQLRHAKLWYASNLNNWALAEYELNQLRESFKRVASVTQGEVQADAAASDGLEAAIAAQDEQKFVAAFDQLTAACNSCHEKHERAFIQIRRPMFPSPFSNQLFGLTELQ